MKKKIYKYFVSISLILINYSVKIKNHKLCAFIIWLNIRKSKEFIYKNKKIKKNVLIFPKSGGYEDLIESFNNNNKNNIVFYLLPRIFLKKIFSNYFEKSYEKDYLTKLKTNNEIYKKKLYTQFLTSTFNFLSNFINLDAFISFNLFYYAEKHFEEVSRNLNTKYIIFQKESALTPLEEMNAPTIYRKYNDRSISYKISVYSECQKRILIKSKIATKKQIIVNGCPRCDYAFKLRKIRPKNKIIVFYLIEYDRNKNFLAKGINKNWKNLYYQTLNYVFEFAKKNSEIKIILKGKTGVHTKRDFKLRTLPENCVFIQGGSGGQLLKDASAVIGFNSSIVFETIASNRNLIIPNFNKENIVRKNLIHKIKNKGHFVNTKKQFYKKLNIYLSSKYRNKKISNPDIKTLKYYMGNTDGSSGKKVQRFLNNVLN
jgi:hypothetical protein